MGRTVARVELPNGAVWRVSEESAANADDELDGYMLSRNGQLADWAPERWEMVEEMGERASQECVTGQYFILPYSPDGEDE